MNKLTQGSRRLRVWRVIGLLGLGACGRLSDWSAPTPLATPVAAVQLTAPRPTVIEGSTLALEVVAIDSGGRPLTGRTVTWSSGDTVVATVSSAGLVTGRRVGRTQIAASVDGRSATVSVTVTPRLVASIAVTPNTPSLLVGGAVQLTARPLDDAGVALTDRPVFWSTSNALIAAVDANGFVTGVAPGVATITATSEVRSTTVAVTVLPVPVATIQLTPSLDTIFVTQTVQLRATLRDSTGASLDGRVVQWSSSSPAIATVSATGLVVGVVTGTATITGVSEGRSATARVVVVPQPVGAVIVSPAQSTLSVGQSLKLTVQVIDEDGTLLPGRAVQYRSSNTGVATVAIDGTVTGVTPGSSTITATSEGRTGTAQVTVTPATVRSVRIEPTSASLRVGATTRLSAVALDENNVVLPQRPFTWLSGAPGIVTVGTDGLVTAIAPGTALVFASAEGRVAAATITVSSVSVATVTVSPATATPFAGSAIGLTADVRDGNGVVLTGREVTWRSSLPAIAVVSNSGRVLAVAPGSVRIEATVEGVTGSALLNVLAVPVASVGVTLATSSIIVGQSSQAFATARDANGNVLSGRTATWTSSAPTVATVSSTGLVTGVSVGTATISASVEGRIGTVQAIVIPVPIASVAVTLGDSSIILGQTTQGAAVARDAGGNALPGRVFTWGTSAPSVATVSTSGLVTAVGEGVATITASSEGRSGTVELSVGGRPVSTVTLTVPRSAIRVSETLQATAVLRDSTGLVVVRPIQWTSSAPTVATVSSTGSITAVGVGSATITATSEGRSATAAISASLIPVTTVAVTVPRTGIRIGEAVSAAAVLRDSAGTVVTRPITWSTSAATVATVSSTGVVTAVGAGSATITATSEGRTGTVAMTVTPIPLTSVTVTTPVSTFRVGEGTQATVVLRDSAGTVVTRPVTWSSSAPAIATVSTTGAIAGVGEGTVTITATSEGRTGTVGLTITGRPVETVTVTVPRSSIRTGEALQATATLRDITGAILTNRPVAWSSSAPAVASVSSSGVITALTPGSTTITASSEGKSGTTSMGVTLRPVVTVTVTVPRPIVRVGEVLTATAVPRDSAGNALTGRTITWTSSSPAVASVSSAGVITAIAAGTTTITATSETRQGTAGLQVTLRPVASMDVSFSSAADSILTRTRTTQATVVQRDSAGNILTGRPVTWSAAPTTVATIGTGGLVTGVGVGGASVVAQSDLTPGSPRATGSRELRVTNVATVTVTTPGPTVRIGQNLQLTAVARDVNSNPVTVTFSWSTSNGNATVNATGRVTGVSVGSVTITATVDGRSNSSTILVIP
jgi:trimeric autotransporter adhesin